MRNDHVAWACWVRRRDQSIGVFEDAHSPAAIDKHCGSILGNRNADGRRRLAPGVQGQHRNPSRKVERQLDIDLSAGVPEDRRVDTANVTDISSGVFPKPLPKIEAIAPGLMVDE